MLTKPITILSVLRDPLPPKRADVLALFGEALVALNIKSHLIGQFGKAKDDSVWDAGKTYNMGHVGGVVASMFIPFWDACSALEALHGNAVDVIQVRYKIFSGVVICCLARLLRLPFVYKMSFPIVEGHQSRAMTVGNTRGRWLALADRVRVAVAGWVFYRVVLPASVHVGKDVLFGYSGLGIVVHARCHIGNHIKIGHRVTLGWRSGAYDVPIIEDDVVIGADTKILGPIRIGRGARVGVNAVVLEDVLADAVVVGVPAHVVRRDTIKPSE